MTWHYEGKDTKTGHGFAGFEVSDDSVPEWDAKFLRLFGGNPYAWAWREPESSWMADSSDGRVTLVEQTATWNWTPWETDPSADDWSWADTLMAAGVPAATGPVGSLGGPVALTSTGVRQSVPYSPSATSAPIGVAGASAPSGRSSLGLWVAIAATAGVAYMVFK